MSEWINLQEMKPKDLVFVLIFVVGGDVHKALLKNNEWFQDVEYCNSSGFITSKVTDRVTHWQPLPEPPQ